MFLPPIPLAFRGAEADEAIIARLQRLEPQALAELYDRYGRIAYALIPGIAEDLVQETFLRVWDRLQTFDAQKGAVGPWLLTVAHNRAIDYLRSTGSRERNAVEFEETDHLCLYTDREPGILASDKARVVKAASEKLSSHQRQIIELVYFEGISQTEMAVRMGQPLGTVKTWVRAALKVLRDELGVSGRPAPRGSPGGAVVRSYL